jgi:hypothetical protein
MPPAGFEPAQAAVPDAAGARFMNPDTLLWPNAIPASDDGWGAGQSASVDVWAVDAGRNGGGARRVVSVPAHELSDLADLLGALANERRGRGFRS